MFVYAGKAKAANGISVDFATLLLEGSASGFSLEFLSQEQSVVYFEE